MRTSQRVCFASAFSLACIGLSGSHALAQAPTGKAPEGEAAPPAAPAAAPDPPPTPVSLAQSLTGMARAEFEAGRILYEDNDFASANVKFQHAYELSGDVRLLWNIAACEKNLRHYTRALAAIERYQSAGAANLSPANQAAAGAFAQVLRTLISTMRLLASEPGAEVFVDGEKVGTTPLAEPVRLDVGRRSVRVHKPGFKDFTETRQVEGATEFTLVAKLEKEVHRGHVIVEAGPKDLLAIDGKAVAQGRWEADLPSGGHTLRATAPGMVPYQTEIVVQDGQSRRIQVTLHPETTASRSSPWPWIAGGAALGVAAIVGSALLYKPTEIPPAQGSIGTFPLSFGGWR